MRVIEFIGCPGSGKSSVCKRVMDELAGKGFDVANIHRNEIRKGALSRKLLSARSRFAPRLHSLRAELDRFTAELPDKDSVWKRDILNAAYKIEQGYVQRLDYVFFEEGPTQYLTSVLHDTAVDDKILPLIGEMNRSFYKYDVTAIFVTADDDEIIDRIRKRNRSGDRFLSDDTDMMHSLLDIKRDNLDKIAKLIDYGKLYHIENHDLDKAVLQVMDLM